MEYIEKFEVYVKGNEFVVVDSETMEEVTKSYKSHRWCCNKASNMNFQFNNK